MGGQERLLENLAVLTPFAEIVRSEVADSQNAWLIGGVVRDALTRVPIVDVDIVTDGDSAQLARALARRSGGAAFPLGDEHGCWRVTAAEDGVQYDVCTLVGNTLASDIAARDFTVNALAVDSRSPHVLIDQVGGFIHLLDGVLHTVSSQAFVSDPLRLLRLVRIAHERGMDIDPQTRALARQHAHLAAQPSGERIFAELSRIIGAADEARRAVLLMDDLGILESVLPELTATQGIDQSDFHHLDVFNHTLAVLDNVEDIAHNVDFFLGHPNGMPVEPFTTESKLLLNFAAVCHDLGKVATRRVHDDGVVRFSGHDEIGAEIVDSLCDRWCTSNGFRSRLALLVRTHLDLGMLLHGPMDARARYRFLRGVEPCAAEAIVLSLGDRMATAGVHDRRRWARRHAALARRLWAGHWREVAHGLPEPLLHGLEIAEAAGIEPGPFLGQLVEALREAQAIGEVHTIGEAKLLVASIARQQ